jgi:hypothetical protein
MEFCERFGSSYDISDTDLVARQSDETHVSGTMRWVPWVGM